MTWQNTQSERYLALIKSRLEHESLDWIEQVLDILKIEYGRYNDKEKGYYMFWRIAKESLEDAE